MFFTGNPPSHRFPDESWRFANVRIRKKLRGLSKSLASSLFLTAPFQNYRQFPSTAFQFSINSQTISTQSEENNRFNIETIDDHVTLNEAAP
jgi:hypothetical protein